MCHCIDRVWRTRVVSQFSQFSQFLLLLWNTYTCWVWNWYNILNLKVSWTLFLFIYFFSNNRLLNTDFQPVSSTDRSSTLLQFWIWNRVPLKLKGKCLQVSLLVHFWFYTGSFVVYRPMRCPGQSRYREAGQTCCL